VTDLFKYPGDHTVCGQATGSTWERGGIDRRRWVVSRCASSAGKKSRDSQMLRCFCGHTLYQTGTAGSCRWSDGFRSGGDEDRCAVQVGRRGKRRAGQGRMTWTAPHVLCRAGPQIWSCGACVVVRAWSRIPVAKYIYIYICGATRKDLLVAGINGRRRMVENGGTTEVAML
jgi:hypothetical protein